MTSLANSETGGRLVLLKGDAAEQAEAVSFVERLDATLEPTGHWAEARNAARDAGFAQGLSNGLAQGRATGEKRASDEASLQASAAVSALGQLMDTMSERETALGEELSEHVTALALTVAEAILSRELAVSSDPGKEAIARCLATAPQGGDVVARLNPADIESLGHLDAVLEGRPVTIVPDTSLTKGDSIVTVGDTRIDGRLSEAMDRVREVLR